MFEIMSVFAALTRFPVLPERAKWAIDTSVIVSFSLSQPTPQVSILPLGTGNDLSRVLGWGEGYTGDVNVKHILDEIERAKTANLDR